MSLAVCFVWLLYWCVCRWIAGGWVVSCWVWCLIVMSSVSYVGFVILIVRLVVGLQFGVGLMFGIVVCLCCDFDDVCVVW